MKRRRVRKQFIGFVGLSLIYSGYLMLLGPYLCDQYARIFQITNVANYAREFNDLDEQDIQAAKQRAYTYNEQVYQQQLVKPYRYQANQDYDLNYLSLPWDEAEELFTIMIAKIKVNLPVGHGTSDELLQVMAGHLYGTSIPCNQKDSHTVVAAHSGLRSSELFSRLDELELDDEIKIRFLDEIYTYQVDKIEIVLPDEADNYLQIIPHEDYLTLYTCTPYGINTHRLLVRAKKMSKVEKVEEDSLKLSNQSYVPLIKIVLLSVGPLIGGGAWIKIKRRKQWQK
ncbi:MAG: class C sortase [Erysipelotrichaceae bacterium]|nr:class C sortase [Erysipelotrichaceae bacterium]